MSQNHFIELSPAQALKRAFLYKGWSTVKAAREIGVHSQTIYNTTGGICRPISSKLALKLAGLFEDGTPESQPYFWLVNPIILPVSHIWARTDDPVIEKVAPLKSSPITNNRKFELAAAYLCEALIDKTSLILSQYRAAFESLTPPLELTDDELHEIMQQASERVIHTALQKQFGRGLG